MKLIPSTLILLFALFFTSIELSTAQSSDSSEGSTGVGSERRRGNARSRSRSSESGQSAESVILRAPSEEQEEFSRYRQHQSESRRRGLGHPNFENLGPSRLGPGLAHSRHSSPENSGTPRSSSPRGYFHRSRSPVHERYPNLSRPSQFEQGETSRANQDQRQSENSAHQSESSRDSTSYSFQPSLPSSPSFPQSPRGPYSFPYDSPSEPSQSDASNNGPPHHP